MTKYIWS